VAGKRQGAAAAASRPLVHSNSQDELWADTPPAGAGARAAFDAEPDHAAERDSTGGSRGAPAAGTTAAAGGPAGAAAREAGAPPTPAVPGGAASDAAGLAPASRLQPRGGEPGSKGDTS